MVVQQSQVFTSESDNLELPSTFAVVLMEKQQSWPSSGGDQRDTQVSVSIPSDHVSLSKVGGLLPRLHNFANII